jgi:hypothetical protein
MLAGISNAMQERFDGKGGWGRNLRLAAAFDGLGMGAALA